MRDEQRARLLREAVETSFLHCGYAVTHVEEVDMGKNFAHINYAAREVLVENNLPPVDSASALLHEYAHAKAFAMEGGFPLGPDDLPMWDVLAEWCAMTVLESFRIAGEERTKRYLSTLYGEENAAFFLQELLTDYSQDARYLVEEINRDIVQAMLGVH